MLITLLILCALLSQSVQSPESAERDWVVRDVFGVDGHPIGFERGWGYDYQLRGAGDLDGDGSVDLLLNRHDQEVNYLATREAIVFGSRGLNERAVLLNQPLQEWLSIQSNFPFLYKAPNELLLHATGTATHGLLGGHSFRLTGSVVAADVSWFWTWIRGFDVDQDGFEELIAEDHLSNGNVLTACLDGRTLVPKWYSTRYLPGSFPSYATLNDPRGWPDLNGDLFPDYLSLWKRWNSVHQDFTISLCAFDGTDGSQLWEMQRHDIGASTATMCWGPDVTGDGVADIVLCDPAELMWGDGLIAMYSGIDGSLIWERTFRSIAPTLRFPGHRAEHLLGFAGFSRPFDGRGPVELLIAVNFEDMSSSNGMGQQRTVMLDARTGTLGTVARESMSAMPWYPDPYGVFAVDLALGRNILGDVDRDGFNEMATVAWLDSLDDPNILGTPTALLILGRKTLFMPKEARPGDLIDVGVHIPSAPDHDFLLLLSQGFKGEGGKTVDGWRTFLVPDALLQSTLAGRYPGRLGANGRGSLTIRLPSNPSLSGSTLYSKAVIFKPGSTTEVWTITSLGITEVL